MHSTCQNGHPRKPASTLSYAAVTDRCWPSLETQDRTALLCPSLDLSLAGKCLVPSPLLWNYEPFMSPSRYKAPGSIGFPIYNTYCLSPPRLSPLPSLPSLAAPHTLPSSRSIKGGSPSLHLAIGTYLSPCTQPSLHSRLGG